MCAATRVRNQNASRAQFAIMARRLLVYCFNFVVFAQEQCQRQIKDTQRENNDPLQTVCCDSFNYLNHEIPFEEPSIEIDIIRKRRGDDSYPEWDYEEGYQRSESSDKPPYISDTLQCLTGSDFKGYRFTFNTFKDLFPKHNPPKRAKRSAPIINAPYFNYNEAERRVSKEFTNYNSFYVPPQNDPNKDFWWRSINRFRCDGSDRGRWSHQVDEQGKTIVPVSFHWSFPVCMRDYAKKWMEKMMNDLGCMRLVVVDNPFTSGYDHGIMLIWEAKTRRSTSTELEEKKGKKGSCSSTGQTSQTSKHRRQYERTKFFSGPVHPGQFLKPMTIAEAKEKFDKGERVYAKPFEDEIPETEFTEADGNTKVENRGDYTKDWHVRFVYKSEVLQPFNQMPAGWNFLGFARHCFGGNTVQHELHHSLGLVQHVT